MKLSLKQKALLITLSVFAIAILSGSAIGFILANVSTQTILNALAFGSFVFLAWMLYGVILARLEYNQSLKEMTEKKN